MRPFTEIDADTARRLQYVLCDIDDTITNSGKLTAEAYSALWALHDAGIGVVPVTGRSAGWCDLIVREWPVEAVIGENGAFVYYFRDGHKQVFTHPNTVENVQEKLLAVLDRVMREVPGSRPSRDQFSRIYDLAIDFREDPPYLDFDDAEKIKSICESMGAVAKVSSIHVNVWFGDYTKRDMARLFFEQVLRVEDIERRAIFFGDSPNDEPMFEFFPVTCGVANVAEFPDMGHKPAFIASKEGGYGFAEAAAHILELRK